MANELIVKHDKNMLFFSTEYNFMSISPKSVEYMFCGKPVDA